MKLALRAAAVALLLAAPGLSQAATLYENAWTTGSFNVSKAWCSTCSFTNQQIFSKFTLTDKSNVTGATWVSFPGYESAASIEIWDATRSTKLYTQSFLGSSITNTVISNIALERTISLTGALLNSGTYWVSFFGPSTLFYGIGSASGEQIYYQNGAYRGDTGTLGAFRLTGAQVPAVPLPGALPLLGAALFGLGALARRKRAA